MKSTLKLPLTHHLDARCESIDEHHGCQSSAQSSQALAPLAELAASQNALVRYGERVIPLHKPPKPALGANSALYAGLLKTDEAPADAKIRMRPVMKRINASGLWNADDQENLETVNPIECIGPRPSAEKALALLFRLGEHLQEANEYGVRIRRARPQIRRTFAGIIHVLLDELARQLPQDNPLGADLRELNGEYNEIEDIDAFQPAFLEAVLKLQLKYCPHRKLGRI